MSFSGKILVIGCGGVSRCTLPLLIRHLNIPPSRYTLIDFEDRREFMKEVISQGINFQIDQITRDNLGSTLSKYVGPGDLIIDIAWNIDCCEILQWCHDHGVLYINTSVELWDPYERVNGMLGDRTLYARHMAIRSLTSKWKEKGPTAIVEHGANPGLVSHFVKLALTEISEKILKEKPNDSRKSILEKSLSEDDFASMARATNILTIHIAERDTQISNRPKEVNEFVNTWSIEGFYEEGTAPAEMGWGTHEKRLPDGAFVHNYGPGNQICLAQMGIKTWVRSWVPVGPITGMVVRHGEAFTISDTLTVWDGITPLYRPTVHYAYCPADAAINSLHELEMRNFDLQKNQRLMDDDIISGADQLGVLLMGHDFKSWWTGSLLTIEETRALTPGQNATTLQVAASILAAVTWMIENPMTGVLVPDNLPHREILKIARPYLGTWYSAAVDWTPLQDRKRFFKGYDGAHEIVPEDTWQFSSFVV